jgi:hypothetical protein
METRSEQINFYITPDELASFDKYLIEFNAAVISLPLKKSKPDICNSISDLSERNYGWDLFFRIARKSDLQSLVIRFVKNQGYYLINTLHSPIIEVTKCHLDENALNIKRGRLFYYPGYYNDENTWESKSPDFLNWANQLFLQFTKTMQFTKTRTGDIVSPEVNKLLQNGWKLI